MIRNEPIHAIIRPGLNCWQLRQASRVAFLIDGAAYFAAFRETVRRASRSVIIIGWDINSRIDLIRDGSPSDDLPNGLSDFLRAAIKRRRGLKVYILAWDFALLYALEREYLPLLKIGWQPHRRLRFHLDDCHPFGGSQHQKIVVIDDAVAFVGGLDLTKDRWDTPEHRPNDPRRRNPDGSVYEPFHDVQMMVDGAAAAAIGELARERWRRATHSRIKTQKQDSADPWPATVQPGFRDIDIAIARTEPCYGGQQEVKEVKQLYLDAIKAAHRWIYMENQYLTSQEIGAALGQRLEEENGPEIVLVSRLRGSGWLEESAMGTLRARLLAQLRHQDHHGRLRVYYPHRDDLPGGGINVHSKVMVVDDCFLRVGSANLNNRSMGYDSECDLAIEHHKPEVQRGIADFRNRLLAEHLGVDPTTIAGHLKTNGSLIRAIESCQGGFHTLKLLESSLDPRLDGLIPDAALIDPEKPVDADEFAAAFVPLEEGPRAVSRLTSVVLLLVAISALAAAWRWTPLREWVNTETLIYAGEWVRNAPAAPLWVLLAYAVASVLAIPITLMILATAVVFDSGLGFLYAMSGSFFGAAITFWLGQVIGRSTVRRLAGRRLNAISRRLARQGTLAMTILRIVPVAPFTIVNLVAGASHIAFRQFAIGTVLGMTPGILALTVFSDRLMASLRDPSPGAWMLLAVLIAILVALFVAIRYWFARRWNNRAGDRRAISKESPAESERIHLA
jgi:phospholipase D1/2